MKAPRQDGVEIAESADTEKLVEDLYEAGFMPMIVVSRLGVVQLAFEIEQQATAPGFALAKQTRARFLHDVAFRTRFFNAVMAIGEELLQPYDQPPPKIDLARTMDDVRRERGIEK